jgi:hypothetical protein
MLIMRLMTAFIGLHVLEILLWAGFYRWFCFRLWKPAFYFSAASYATVGCGDLVLPWMWRTLGPVESIIGVLMCGLSASFLFAIVSRLVERLRSGAQRFHEGSIAFPFPLLFSGIADVCEWYDDAEREFKIEVSVTNKVWGRLFGYKGRFQADWQAVRPPEIPADILPHRTEKRE